MFKHLLLHTILNFDKLRIIFILLAVKNNREDGFHLDLEDFLLGLLQLSAELVCIFCNLLTYDSFITMCSF